MPFKTFTNTNKSSFCLSILIYMHSQECCAKLCMPVANFACKLQTHPQSANFFHPHQSAVCAKGAQIAHLLKCFSALFHSHTPRVQQQRHRSRSLRNVEESSAMGVFRVVSSYSRLQSFALHNNGKPLRPPWNWLFLLCAHSLPRCTSSLLRRRRWALFCNKKQPLWSNTISLT